MKKKASKAKPAKATKRSSAKPEGKRATKAVQVQLPEGASEADRREAAYFVKTLKANKQLARQRGRLTPGTTHQLEPDESGTERLVRKRYSAL